MRFAVLKEIFRVIDYVPMPLDIFISRVVCMHINNKGNDAPLSRARQILRESSRKTKSRTLSS